MDRARRMLSSGDWLTLERVRLIAAAILIASTLGFLFLVVTAHGLIDRQGRPIGTDFSNVYAAGTYVLEGNPYAPFDPPQQETREQALFGANTQFYGWHYPPYFLFVAAALAKLPYGAALTVWQGSTLCLYLLMMGGIVSSFRGAQRASPESMKPGSWLWLLLALAFPVVLINIGHGQNGFLTAALLGGALLLLDRRPLIAGILFGLLIYKPQFGIMIPVALLATLRWRTFAAAAVTVAILTLVTTAAFGPDVWHAFKLSTEFSRKVVLEQGQTGWYKIQSVFSWARMWGASIPLAYALQSIATAAVGAALVWLWRSRASSMLKASGLCLATILATPYTLDYDMMVLAPAIAFFAVEGLQRGFRPWEKTMLAALWLTPIAARSVAEAMLIPLGVLMMLAMFAIVIRRAVFESSSPMAFAVAPPTIAHGTGGAAGGHDIAAFE